jgi:hypothetical protein
MRLALYLLSYKLWCMKMGFEFDSRSMNSVAINYKSFRGTYTGRKNMNYSIRDVIKKIKGEN